jgi:Domain of unknown function (DUF4381)
MNQGIDYAQIPLRDIHLPGPVGLWPPAPGWWILLALVLAGLVVATYHYVRTRHRRATLAILRRISARLAAGAEPAACLAGVSSVMRRFAMSAATNPALVAGLVGSAWLSYLDSRWDRHAFSEGVGRALTVAPYLPAHAASADEAAELTALCIDWVRHQRVRG